jgi:signal transduction histidine kinase
MRFVIKGEIVVHSPLFTRQRFFKRLFISSGSGIPAEHILHIFGPFFTTKVNGTDLRLSFVIRVANEHGGLVVVKSQVGKISCFTIHIPIVSDV